MKVDENVSVIELVRALADAMSRREEKQMEFQAQVLNLLAPMAEKVINKVIEIEDRRMELREKKFEEKMAAEKEKRKSAAEQRAHEAQIHRMKQDTAKKF
jgi:hypothetical protein